MYKVDWDDLLVVHDVHPEYASTFMPLSFRPATCAGVQHHRAHVASVLAERQAWEKRVVGISFDGTGYGDDGTIWGGEFFTGSLAGGLQRVLHLRNASLPGGDAAARHPVQCAAGFLSQLNTPVDFTAPPFHFDHRYHRSAELLKKNVRSFETTSIGRLFDGAAALWASPVPSRSKDKRRSGWSISRGRPQIAMLILFRSTAESWTSGRFLKV